MKVITILAVMLCANCCHGQHDAQHYFDRWEADHRASQLRDSIYWGTRDIANSIDNLAWQQQQAALAPMYAEQARIQGEIEIHNQIAWEAQRAKIAERNEKQRQFALNTKMKAIAERKANQQQKAQDRRDRRALANLNGKFKENHKAWMESVKRKLAEDKAAKEQGEP